MNLSRSDWRDIWFLAGVYFSGVSVGILVGLTMASRLAI
jgi:hypothetical protein